MKIKLLSIFYVILSLSGLRSEEASWKNSLTLEAGNFLDIPPFNANYEFGWFNMGAATAEVAFYYSGDHYFFSARGGTYGWIRKLWKLDATQITSGSRTVWLPKTMHQSERYRSYAMIMDVRYQLLQADRLRMVVPTLGKIPERQIFPIKNMRDMVAAMLFVRSQPLRDGEEVSQIVFPGDSPFLIKIKVLGRENIHYKGKLTPTIKFNLSMKKILTEGAQKESLVPHRKFNSGTIWISDDAQRIPIRAEIDIFVGFIYAQLQSVQF